MSGTRAISASRSSSSRTLSNPSHSSPATSCSAHFGPWAQWRLHVPRPLCQRWRGCGRQLGRVDVHLRLREVGETTGVVEVEVGGDDVANIARFEAERLDLPDRGFGHGWARGNQHARDKGDAAGVFGIRGAHPGVDEDQLVAGLDQQAMGDELRPLGPAATPRQEPCRARAEGPAAQMVDAHDTSLFVSAGYRPAHAFGSSHRRR